MKIRPLLLAAEALLFIGSNGKKGKIDFYLSFFDYAGEIKMKENNRSRTHHNNHTGLQKGLIIGLFVGAFLGFLIPFLISGTLPFTESYSMGLGDMKELITIFYFYCIAGGAVLGFIIGLIVGTLVDFIKR